MTPIELRDQVFAEIVADFEAAGAAFDPVAGLPSARRGLHQLHNAALGGQCASLEPAQRDQLIRSYMVMLRNLGPTIEGNRPYPAFHAWARGPVGVILFWYSVQNFAPQVVADTVSLGASFLHLVADAEQFQAIVQRSNETPGLFSFIERAIAEHGGTPLPN